MYPLDKIPAMRYNMRMRGLPVSNLKGDFKMKKSVRILAVVMVLLMVTLVFASCGKTLKGKYASEFMGTGSTLEFSGKNITITYKLAGAELASVEGTYEIKDNDEGKTVIVFTFGDDDASKYSGEFDFSEGTEDGKSYIKIGGVQYKKVD